MEAIRFIRVVQNQNLKGQNTFFAGPLCESCEHVGVCVCVCC